MRRINRTDTFNYCQPPGNSVASPVHEPPGPTVHHPALESQGRAELNRYSAKAIPELSTVAALNRSKLKEGICNKSGRTEQGVGAWNRSEAKRENCIKSGGTGYRG